jgi:hypothetical protein
MNHCKNYASPLHEKACKVGITFEALRTKHGSFLNWPCMAGRDSNCDKAEWLTPKEVAENDAAFNKQIAKTMKGIRAAAEFRAANKGRSNQDTVKCPECGGQLHLTIAACNGHVHGKCETPNCIAWME